MADTPAGAAQMPAAPNSGPAPLPYGGADLSPEPPTYNIPAFTDAGGATSAVLDGVSGNALQESGYAHDINAGLITPFVSGHAQQIYVGGDNDAGGRDTVTGTVAGAVANAEARWKEYESDIVAAGAMYGDQLQVPAVPEDANTPSNDFLVAGGDQPGKGTPRQEDVG